jgi:tetratricopeptide (TPR) repeat protein
MRNYDAVIADSSAALRLEPNAGSFNFRALAYLWQGDYDRAIADSTEAIKLSPSNAVLLTVRAVALTQKGDLDRAWADLGEVLKLNPDLWNAYAFRGTLLSQRGEHERALADLDKAVTLSPNGAQPYFRRAAAHERAGRFDQALADFRKLLSIDIASEQPAQVVARIENRMDEIATAAIARIEQQLAARTATPALAGLPPPAASPATPGVAAPGPQHGFTPEIALGVARDVLMTSCTPVPLGEHVVKEASAPQLQVMQDIGLANVVVVRKNADGATVYYVTLADGVDRGQLARSTSASAFRSSPRSA